MDTLQSIYLQFYLIVMAGMGKRINFCQIFNLGTRFPGSDTFSIPAGITSQMNLHDCIIFEGKFKTIVELIYEHLLLYQLR